MYIFDEHNEAFFYWHKALVESYLDPPLDLFHVDAHSDMSQLLKLENSIYYSSHSDTSYLDYFRKISQVHLNISNFIIPAVLNGIIKNVYFIFPNWRSFKRGRRKYNVSSAFGEGKMLKHNLSINNSTNPKVLKAFPDLIHFSYFRLALDSIPSKRKVILDFDLDYFACTDSILNHMIFKLEITKDQFDHREDFIAANKSLPYSGLNFDFSVKNGKYYAHIAHKKTKDASFLPTKRQIDKEIDNTINILAIKKVRPVLITICRSNISGYCPPDYSVYIEKKLRTKIDNTW